MFETIYQKQKALKRYLIGSLMLLTSFVASAQCNANFTSTNIGSGSISFASSSTGSYPFSSYVWNFGDGSTGYGFSTTHNYLANNTYNAILYYTNYDSILGLTCKDSIVKPIVVTNVAPCNFSVTLGYTTGTSGLASFTCTSLQTSNISVSWNFGDGSFGTGSSLNHVYVSNGVFTVTALAHQLGTACYDTVSQTITITNSNGNPCSGIANFSDTALSGGNIYFTSTSISNSPITSYVWNFGDGSLGNGSSVMHTYNFNNTYNVILYITSFDSLLGTSCSDSIVKSVVITNANSNPCNTASIITYNYGTNGVVNFKASSLMNPNYSWHFGDGSIGVGDSISHTYSMNGIYNAYVVANLLGSGCSDTVFQNITVTNVVSNPCNLNPIISATYAANGFVGFTCLPSPPAFVNYSTTWNFGDGTFGNGNNVNHQYNANGVYSVTAITQILGTTCYDTISKSITVSNASGLPCNINASFNFVPGANGSGVFNNTTTGPILWANFLWNFGDGNSSSIFSNGNVSAQHTYASNGVYNVSLVVVDTVLNCVDSFSSTITISNAAPAPCIANVTFTMAPDTSAALTWMAMPIYAPTTTSAVWYWGDGTSTSGFNPSHTYLAPGVYNICVIATDVCGDLDTACMTSNIFKSSNNSGLIYTVNVLSNFTPLGSLSTKNIVKDKLKINVFPNPNNGEFTINSKLESQFSVMNELGQIIRTDVTNAANNFSAKVSGLNTGVYYILVTSKETTYRKKIVVTQ